MWAGVTMTEGKPLTSESAVTIPVINAPLTVHSQFELVRREACTRGERETRLRSAACDESAGRRFRLLMRRGS